MPDIYHDFPIRADAHRVFDAITTPEGLQRWWTKASAGQPILGSEYELWFGPAYDWRARVSECVPSQRFELQMTQADADWIGSRVGFELAPSEHGTVLRFHHTGWPESNQHYRTSTFCWAMYLRVLRRYLEFGEEVAYERRLDV